MYVQLCWKDKDTEEGKINVFEKRITVKQAMALYKTEMESTAIKAYLRHFDGWHWNVYKKLK